jgi:hypothetical protein
MAEEPETAHAFTDKDPSVVKAKADLNSLRAIYTTMKKPTWIAISLGVFLYLLLLVPYLIQRRNTKSIYTIWGERGSSQKPKQTKRPKDSDDNLDEGSSNEDDFSSFTM